MNKMTTVSIETARMAEISATKKNLKVAKAESLFMKHSWLLKSLFYPNDELTSSSSDPRKCSTICNDDQSLPHICCKFHNVSLWGHYKTITFAYYNSFNTF